MWEFLFLLGSLLFITFVLARVPAPPPAFFGLLGSHRAPRAREGRGGVDAHPENRGSNPVGVIHG